MYRIRIIALTFTTLCTVSASTAAQIEVPLYGVHELQFAGPICSSADCPARDIELLTQWRHESGTPTCKILGFWDGDGKGGSEGKIFKVRFCPTKMGKWTLVRTESNNPKLDGQNQGYSILCTISHNKGFWIPDQASGNRWYKRSDGSHPYIVGNTMYSFLSEYDDKGPTGGNVADDIKANSKYFKKVRFALTADRYPHPTDKPFLDDVGNPTDNGNFSHRPNPAWFHKRVDLAVQTALDNDLIADMILNGPDTEHSRSVLRAAANEGDCTPLLKYIAARYGSYPNVWMCLANEFDIKEPKYTTGQIIRFGQTLRGLLPYQTPMSVHARPRDWYKELNSTPAWHDHVTLQKKIKKLPIATDFIARNYPIGSNKPVIDDELAYEGKGDGWTEADVIEAHLGAFLGGGYGTTGHKPASKKGHYFFGNFKASEHKSADNLLYLSKVIDENITFWQMSPVEDSDRNDTKAGIFENIDPDFRVMQWPGCEYVLGANKRHRDIKVNLPAGRWRIESHEIIHKKTERISENAQSEFIFNVPQSRATLFHFRRIPK